MQIYIKTYLSPPLNYIPSPKISACDRSETCSEVLLAPDDLRTDAIGISRRKREFQY